MNKKVVFEFLEALTANNSKEWMDANRKWYEEAKAALIEVFDPILMKLKDIDPRIVQPNARKSIYRINNNLMFHPDRPTYKDHFGVGFGHGKGLADFYVHLGVSECFVAGGLWHPSTEKLKMVRTEVDYEAQKLKRILSASDFQEIYGGFWQGDKLKTSPKGYDTDHEMIDVLKLKSFAVVGDLKKADVLSGDFEQKIIDSYTTVLPLIDFLNVAILED